MGPIYFQGPNYGPLFGLVDPSKLSGSYTLGFGGIWWDLGFRLEGDLELWIRCLGLKLRWVLVFLGLLNLGPAAASLGLRVWEPQRFIHDVAAVQGRCASFGSAMFQTPRGILV